MPIYLGNRRITDLKIGNRTIKEAHCCGLVYRKDDELSYVTDGLLVHLDGIKKFRTTNPFAEYGFMVWEDISGNNYDFLAADYESLIINGNNVEIPQGVYGFTGGVELVLEAGEVVDYLPMPAVASNSFTIEIVVSDCDLATMFDHEPLWHSQYKASLGGVINRIGVTAARTTISQQLKGSHEVGAYFNSNNHIIYAHKINASAKRTFSLTLDWLCVDGEAVLNVGHILQPSTMYQYIDIGGVLSSVPMGFKCYSFRIYNRILSERELMQNAKMDKKRFGGTLLEPEEPPIFEEG